MSVDDRAATSQQDDLLPYYLRELTYLRRMGADFAARYPALAGRLDLGGSATTDPHVERLLESFAFLTGRIQYNIDNEFAEVPSALLDTLYPHLQAPVPSMAIAQLELDPAQGKVTSGFLLDKQTSLLATTQTGLTYRFRTCYPVTLWPLRVLAVELAAASASGLSVPSLRLRLAPQGLTLRELELDQLRFCLWSEPTVASLLYELLFCYGQDVHVLPVSAPEGAPDRVALTAASRLPAGSLAPIGFNLDEAVLPYPRQAHPAYRLLQEYFVFPQKFHFFDIRNIDLTTLGVLFDLGPSFADEVRRGGPVSVDLRHIFGNRGFPLAAHTTILPDESAPNAWLIAEGEQRRYQVRQEGERLSVYRADAPTPAAIDIWITFDPQARSALSAIEATHVQVDEGTFRLGCTPIINLFPQTTEPIRLDHTQVEYELIPNAQRQATTEVHSVESVVALSEQATQTRTIVPLYGLNHAAARRNQKMFWHARRLPSMRGGLPGTAMYLAFTDLAFNPTISDVHTVYAQTLCTNRGLAEQLPPGALLQVEQPAPLRRITCLDKPTPQITPPLRGASLWRLVSHLSINRLSLHETVRFGLDKAYRADLVNKHLTAELRRLFRAQGIVLSPRVTVLDGAGADTWIIGDQDTGRTFTVVEEAARLSVSDSQDGLQALREILAIYCAPGNLSALDQIAGIAEMICRRVARRVSGDAWGGIGRGIEVTLVFDEDQYQGQSPFLLAAVLRQFLALYVSATMFTEVVARRRRLEGEWKRWPPLAGEQIAL